MKYSNSAETTRGICVFCSKLLEAAKKKKKRNSFPRKRCFQKNTNIDYCAFTFFLETNSTEKNAQFQTTGDKQHNTRALRSLNGDEKNVNVLKSPESLLALFNASSQRFMLNKQEAGILKCIANKMLAVSLHCFIYL